MLSIKDLDSAARWRLVADLLNGAAARHREAANRSVAMGDLTTAELERWSAELVKAHAQDARNSANAEERLARKRLRAARRSAGREDRTDPAG
jgi:phosphoribosylaminoimidazole carboxylase (NCAIR synthetase)